MPHKVVATDEKSSRSSSFACQVDCGVEAWLFHDELVFGTCPGGLDRKHVTIEVVEKEELE